jgi:hypothetical protein
MSFDWQGQRVLLKKENPIKFQAIKLEQLNCLSGNHKQVAEFYLCSLRILEEDDHSFSSLKVKSPSYHNSDTTLTSLLKNYHDKFKEPEGLPPPDHVIPLKEMSQTINL